MNELVHHGVKGQKWGVRRYQKIKKSLSKDNLSKVANIAKKKTKTGYQKSKAEIKFDRSHQDRWKSDRKAYNKTKSKGRHVANLMLNGPFGSYTYNSLRISGYDRRSAETRVIVSGLLGGPIGHIAMSTITANQYKKANYK